jgi:ribosomal protein L3 glutamine methyltransferase
MAPSLPLSQQLETIRDYVRWGVTQFTRGEVYFGHGTDNALDESLRLVLHILAIPRGTEEHLLDAKLTEVEREQVLQAIAARVRDRKPLAYIIGEALFAGLTFKVDERVLIPRSPIAELIAQGFAPWLGGQRVDHILDLCTGCGCIGIACAHYFEEASVDLVDLSVEALQVATDNIHAYELQGRVAAVESDLFSALAGRRYQLIVSNPPYVDREDLQSMPPEYRHEPAMALGSGIDGLDITRRILRQAADYLTDDGILVVEVGNSGRALEQSYPQIPFTWLEFEHGGHGVFVLSRSELMAYQSAFV